MLLYGIVTLRELERGRERKKERKKGKQQTETESAIDKWWTQVE